MQAKIISFADKTGIGVDKVIEAVALMRKDVA